MQNRNSLAVFSINYENQSSMKRYNIACVWIINICLEVFESYYTDKSKAIAVAAQYDTEVSADCNLDPFKYAWNEQRYPPTKNY